MDFFDSNQLLELCSKYNCSISTIMERREICVGERSREYIDRGLERIIEVMTDSAHTPISDPKSSIGGLIGGEGKKLMETVNSDSGFCGNTLLKGIAYAMAVLEVNSTMGVIVAAPTAGSAGIVPGCILSVAEDYNFSEDVVKKALMNAGAVGYLFMRNGSVSGAEAGCQAEVGAASAMASSALVELFGGTPEMCLNAAALAISNLLGLVCDPICGLVESPCQSRNAIGVSNAFTCAQLSLSNIKHPIPLDEMIEAMVKVGRSLPFELRETALGGNAGTPTGCSACKYK